LILSNISKNILKNIPFLTCLVSTFVQIFNLFFDFTVLFVRERVIENGMYKKEGIQYEHPLLCII